MAGLLKLVFYFYGIYESRLIQYFYRIGFHGSRVKTHEKVYTIHFYESS